MPTYEYRCEACAHGFELFQSIKADPVTTCPRCGAERVRRVIGAGGGFIFRGSGFYITDYTRSSDYKEKAKSDGSSGTPAPKTESKPESKPSTGDGSAKAASGSSAPAA
jgi:putative FmdB family regulatory protein